MKQAPIKPNPQYPGEKWPFYEAPKSHGTSGASGSVSSTQQPVAGPSSASIQDETSNQYLKVNKAPKKKDRYAFYYCSQWKLQEAAQRAENWAQASRVSNKPGFADAWALRDERT
ncbi:Hypothetical predicted protein [Cloeon dipterum]|uniref:Uncharacterized protein n=1 Tax=Cloeon dipterum TaxID=197152 RepID=A0A8S1CYX3_9INSE|nr:Hypothetical predicted protein [Cloeon dipterum]